MSSYSSKVKPDATVFRPQSTRLLDQMREVMRYHHYGLRTEQAYIYWMKDFIFFHNKRHPKEMGKIEIEAYLSYLAVERNVAVSTQNQAFNGLLFLYKQVLNLPFADDITPVRSKKAPRLPVVLSRNEVATLLGCMQGDTGAVVSPLDALESKL